MSESSNAAGGVDESIVVVGSINADVYVDIERLPKVGETISADPQSGTVATGGKVN
jgi:ribokinase